MGVYLLVGMIAALCLIAVTGSRVLLPRWERGELFLGFLGQVIVGMAAAVIIDSNPVVAFLGAMVVLVGIKGPEWVNNRRVEMRREDADRLQQLRRKLRVAEGNLAMFGPGEAPLHLQLMIDEIKREIAELENE